MGVREVTEKNPYTYNPYFWEIKTYGLGRISIGK